MFYTMKDLNHQKHPAIMKKLNRFTLLAIVSLAVVSCGLITGDDEVTRAELQALEEEIMEEIGTPMADVAEQCRVIAFGSKPCGGPWEYLVYSVKVSDEERLKRLVRRYNEMEEEYNEEHDIFSDCSVTPRPEVGLVDGRCTAVSN